jgi:hypothetical protein
MEWLAQIAPGIATALGGPLAGLAVSAISKALGIDEKDVQSTIDSGKLTSDQLANLKQAEIQLQAQAQELGLNFEKLAVDDRKSARDMEISTKSSIPAILAFIVIGGFCAITALKVLGYAIVQDPTIQDLLTTLRDGVILVLSFYFGSSAGSQKKDELLHQSTPTT